jgi:hypothetical protein
MGAGLSFGGVPCIQFDMLEMFFREDRYVISGAPDGARDIALPLPKAPDLASLLRFYLANPAAIWFRRPAVTTQPVVCCKIEKIDIRFEHRTIDLPHTIEREPYCRQRLVQWEALLSAI